MLISDNKAEGEVDGFQGAGDDLNPLRGAGAQTQTQ